MSAPFKVGDICILQNCVALENNGKECTITGGLELRNTRNFGWVVTYRVEAEDGETYSPTPSQLRRRPPSDSHERTYMQKWRDMAGKAPQRVGETV